MTKKDFYRYLKIVYIYELTKMTEHYWLNNKLIQKRIEKNQKKLIEDYKKHCAKSEEIQFVWGYKGILKFNK